MATPPKIKNIVVDKKSLNVKSDSKPALRQKEIHHQPLDKSLELPNSIHINNIDDSFVEFIKQKYQLSIDGNPIPIYHHSLDRYHEYTQQWLNNDSTNTPELPLISVTRESLPKKGTQLGSYFNIPTNEKFTLSKDSKIVNGHVVHELHQISQPVQIDLKYNVNVFTSKLTDIDKINERIILDFSAKQQYITVFGHYMGITLEDLSDSTVKELEKRRYYNHHYVFLLRGYLYDECGFEKTKSINKINIPILTASEKPCAFNIKNETCQKIFELYFNKKESNEKNFILNSPVMFTGTNMKNDNFKIYKNGIETQIPFNGNKGDEIVVKILNLTKSSVYKLYSEQQ